MSLTKVSYSMINGAPVNVRDFGATGDGTTNDSPFIQAAIDATTHGTIYFPIPSAFYRLEDTITVTGKTGITLEGATMVYINTTEAMFRWYGEVNKEVFLLVNNQASNAKNISISGRGIAGVVGLQIAKTPSDGGVNFSSFENIFVSLCDIGISIGTVFDGGVDVSNLGFVNIYTNYNTSQGFAINSSNAQLSVKSLSCGNNGLTPAGGKKGCNIYSGAGHWSLYEYVSGGSIVAGPSHGDIYLASGSLNVYGAWSDTLGPFLLQDTTNGFPASQITLSGIRHWEGHMDETNTPVSISYIGVAPLTLIDCFLWGDVSITDPVIYTKVIDVGTTFYGPGTSGLGATFNGAGLLANNNYIGLGTATRDPYYQNTVAEARFSVGRPAPANFGHYNPHTVWSKDLVTGLLRTTGVSNVTERLVDSAGSYELMLNCCWFDSFYRSMAAGPVSKFYIDTSGNVSFMTVSDPATAGGQILGFDDVLQRTCLPQYINNAAAKAGGLTAGCWYRTGGDPDVICTVH